MIAPLYREGCGRLKNQVERSDHDQQPDDENDRNRNAKNLQHDAASCLDHSITNRQQRPMLQSFQPWRPALGPFVRLTQRLLPIASCDLPTLFAMEAAMPSTH